MTGTRDPLMIKIRNCVFCFYFIKNYSTGSTSEYAYVEYNGEKLPVAKRFLREDYLETAEEVPVKLAQSYREETIITKTETHFRHHFILLCYDIITNPEKYDLDFSVLHMIPRFLPHIPAPFGNPGKLTCIHEKQSTLNVIYKFITIV